MAQLIKLQDYVSRYDTDLTRYPSQYIRLKTQQWKKIKQQWETGTLTTVQHQVDQEEPVDKQSGVFTKFKQIFKREEEVYEEPVAVMSTEREEILDITLPFQPRTELQLKQQFLDHLLKFQIKWASSTLTEKSFVDSHYYRDARLKYLLQRFPDTFLLLYEPVFLLKKAPVEAEVLLITPTEIWCLAFLETVEDAAYIGSREHFWEMKMSDTTNKVLNPTLSVYRMEKIVKQLFQLYEVTFPIKKAVMSRNGYIDYPDHPDELLLLDKRTYEQWFERLRNLKSPLKMMQIRAAKALLEYCQTTSFRRPDWEQEYVEE